MSLPAAAFAATAGNLVGSLFAYALGASHLLDRLPIVGQVLCRWEGLLERYGTRAVFIARLLPLARTFVSLPAGARRVGVARFVVLTALGCALWALGFIAAGMLAASAWSAVESVLGRALLVVGLLVLAKSLLHRTRR
jgi:membrane protein DedA with SNARE-associated domain